MPLFWRTSSEQHVCCTFVQFEVTMDTCFSILYHAMEAIIFSALTKHCLSCFFRNGPLHARGSDGSGHLRVCDARSRTRQVHVGQRPSGWGSSASRGVHERKQRTTKSRYKRQSNHYRMFKRPPHISTSKKDLKDKCALPSNRMLQNFLTTNE